MLIIIVKLSQMVKITHCVCLNMCMCVRMYVCVYIRVSMCVCMVQEASPLTYFTILLSPGITLLASIIPLRDKGVEQGTDCCIKQSRLGTGISYCSLETLLQGEVPRYTRGLLYLVPKRDMQG